MAVRHSAQNQSRIFQHPSWWIVVVAGILVIVFTVAIVREFINGLRVRQQVQRLEQTVAAEQEQQTQLRSLIDYLSSPTFQEREARLKLGLKKSGERVVVVPPSESANVNAPATGGSAAVSASTPAKWWQYFFGQPNSSSTS